MTLSEIDLINRIPFLKIRSRKSGAFTTVSALVAGKLIAQKRASSKGQAVKSLRSNLLEDKNPAFIVKENQKRRVREVLEGDVIFNATLLKLETYVNGNWV